MVFGWPVDWEHNPLGHPQLHGHLKPSMPFLATVPVLLHVAHTAVTSILVDG